MTLTDNPLATWPDDDVQRMTAALWRTAVREWQECRAADGAELRRILRESAESTERTWRMARAELARRGIR